MDQLVKYNQMRSLIAECHQIDEVKEIRDQAAALAEYARQAKDFDAERQLVAIRLRAERRAGELLIEMSGNGTRQTKGGDRKSKSKGETLIEPSLSDLGITKQQSSDWQKLARVPESKVDAALLTLRRIRDVQDAIFGRPKPDDWREHWVGMPAFHQENLQPWKTVKVHFKSREDMEAFATLVGQKIGEKTQYIWHPKAESQKVAHLAWVETEATPDDMQEDELIEVTDEG